MFPSSMLSGLFVKGSLRNTDKGFELRLRNNIDSGTVTGLGPMGLDNATISTDKIVLKVGQKESRGDQLSYRAPLSILDATSGKTLATVAETAPVRQIIAADGIAVVYSQDAKPEAETPKRKGKGKGKAKEGPPGALIAVEGATGKVLWRKQVPALHSLSLAIEGGRVVFLRAGTLAALDL